MTIVLSFNGRGTFGESRRERVSDGGGRMGPVCHRTKDSSN